MHSFFNIQTKKKMIIDGKRFIKNSDVSGNKFDTEDYLSGNVQVPTTEIREGTELGEALKELNDDTIALGTRTSGIDMRSRLHHMEVSSILAVDSLVSFRMLPVNCLTFTRQKKRLSVSLAGKGRDDIVSIVGGQRQHDVKKGFNLGERLSGFFGGKKDADN